MQDQTLICKDCGKPFIWTVSEQQFFQSKGFSAPVRCADCRKALKDKKGTGSAPVSRGPRTMHEITCANCGAKGEVPFEPRDPSNILCVDCFRKKNEAANGSHSAGTVAPASAPDHVHTPVEPAPAEAAVDNANEMGAASTEEDSTTLDA